MSSKQIDNEESLSPEQSLMKTISEAGMRDTAIDLAEIGLDKLFRNLQDETLSQVPIIKSVYSLAKMGLAIREYRFLKKLLLFVSGLKEVDDEFKKSLEDKHTDSDYREKIGQELINALDIFDQISKADALFKIFSAYVKNEINYEQFSQYVYVLQNIDLNKLKILREFYYSEKYHPSPGTYLSSTPDMSISRCEVQKKWHLLQGFISVGLVSLDLGSRTEASSRIPIPLNFPGKLKCNNFGGKFLQILELLKIEN